MTQEEYLNTFGLRCPNCSSTDLFSIGPLEADAGVVWQRIKCQSCSHTYTDHYQLTGFSDLKEDRA